MLVGDTWGKFERETDGGAFGLQIDPSSVLSLGRQGTDENRSWSGDWTSLGLNPCERHNRSRVNPQISNNNIYIYIKEY